MLKRVKKPQLMLDYVWLPLWLIKKLFPVLASLKESLSHLQLESGMFVFQSSTNSIGYGSGVG